MPLELAEIFRAHQEGYCSTREVPSDHLKVMRAIINCRTEALGGHLYQCDQCGHQHKQYHSCRNRHCPKCQVLDKVRWTLKREAELLPIPYFHIVFTLPHTLNTLVLANPKYCYELLFKCASQTLLTFGKDPKWLGGELGITMVLHTWGQNLSVHPHAHCIVTGGALTEEKTWQPAKKGHAFLFPCKALAQVFRAKFIEQLGKDYSSEKLKFTGAANSWASAENFKTLIQLLWDKDWVVYAKRPFAGPKQVVQYLGRYTHRIALTNDRLLATQKGSVSFSWKDYKDNQKRKILTLHPHEFIRRFLQHTLPHQFVRIRYYGLYANRYRSEKLTACLILLAQISAPKEPKDLSAKILMLTLCQFDITLCPACKKGRLILLGEIIIARRWALYDSS